MTPQAELSGRRVLIVEDRYLIAAEMSEAVRGMGAEVLGPASSVAGALAILEGPPPDAALLDVNLEGDRVFPVAEALLRSGAPFAFLTGYDSSILPERWRDAPRLAKPVDPGALRDLLLRLLRPH
jgi:CheY-like chemotaxis protein